jgi:hypothetical protein
VPQQHRDRPRGTAVLALWGTDPAGPPDFDRDGDVGITDFLTLLAHWGACPEGRTPFN